MGTASLSLDLHSLRTAYRTGTASPPQVLARLLEAIRHRGADGVWIDLLPPDAVLAAAEDLRRRDPQGNLPLHGVPFAVKDNIDVAGRPTSAGCPAFATVAAETAPAVQRLLDAGAVLLGKTNLDQFATGLVGVRTPFPVPRNPFHPEFIPGGSSSGSAVAVAAGLVSFALGTDTAGSGRVPAACNNIVGLKPTRGLVSTRGVVPACRSLDCVSVLALTVPDAMAVLAQAAGLDAADAYSRAAPPGYAPQAWPLPERLRFGVPRPEQREFFGDAEAARLYQLAVQRLGRLGGEPVEFDLGPLLEAAQLLYGGPWVAERTAAIEPFLAAHAADMHPVVRDIIAGGARFSAVQAFQGQYRLRELCRAAEALWGRLDCLLLPTVGTPYRIAQVLADPLRLNANLGRYTNFVNLLDLCAIAVPAGLGAEGVPWGVSLIAPAWREPVLAPLAAALHRAAAQELHLTLGATGLPLPPQPPVAQAPAPPHSLLVLGAHMRDLPLNGDLRNLGATFLRAAYTASAYRLYALPGGPPARPGLVRVANGGQAIAGELWHLPPGAWGALLERVAPPLGIGTVELRDGALVKGFLCEAHGAAGARDISGFGGWRAWLASGQA